MIAKAAFHMHPERQNLFFDASVHAMVQSFCASLSSTDHIGVYDVFLHVTIHADNMRGD